MCRPAFEILGYVATPDGIKPSKKKLEALKKFPLPASVKETQSFLGIVSWFRRFIENCSARSHHLRACASVKDLSKFRLTPEAKKEFELLKEVMASEPCLAHPKLDEQLYIHVDASIAGLGAILTQPDNKGCHRVIEYVSKAYDSATTTGLLASNSNHEAHGTIQNKKMGDGIMIGNMYYFPMKIQNTNFAINQRSKMTQVDGNQPIARADQHPLETIIEAKDPTLPPEPILM